MQGKRRIALVCFMAAFTLAVFAAFLPANGAVGALAESEYSTDLVQTEATVTKVGVYQNYPYFWFQIPESDYANAGSSYSIKNNLEAWQEGFTQTKYIHVLAQFADTLFSKIEMDGKLISERITSFDGKDPYFNLWNQVTPSFSFNAISQPQSSVIVYAGATFPSHAYVADIVAGGTGEGKPVYVIKENAYFLKISDAWTPVTEAEFYNVAVGGISTVTKDGASYLTVTPSGANFGSGETDLSAYAEKLNALNTLDYIKVGDTKLSETAELSGKKLSDLAPCYNAGGSTGFSFKVNVDTAKTVTVLEGCQIPTLKYLNGEASFVYTANKEITFVYNTIDNVWAEYIPDQDITANFISAHYEDWSDGVKICFDTNYRLADVGNGSFLVDSTKYKVFLDYITVNGKSINEINTENSGNTYSYTTFPGSMGGRYATAAYILLTNHGTDGNRFNIYLHKDYYATLDSVTVGVSEDFLYFDGVSNHTVTKAVEFRDVYGSFISTDLIKGYAEITASVNTASSLIREDGSASIRVDLTEVDFTNIGYGLNEQDAEAVFANVKINGVSAKDINDKTDTSAYDWSVCPPFNYGAAYQKPVNVYFTNGFMNVRIHPAYVAGVIGDQAIEITVESGVEVFDTDDGYCYKIAQTVSGTAIPARYVVTFVDGQTTVGSIKLLAGQTINYGKYLAEKDHYTFLGWVEEDGTAASTAMPEENYTVYSAFEAVKYSVTFVNDGVQVGEAQYYTVENASVTAPELPAAPEHYTLAWEEYDLDFTNVTVNAVKTAIEYTVTFTDGETVVATETYTVDDPYVTLPEVPAKEGYKAGWENVSLDGGDKTVNAVYELIEQPSREVITVGGGCGSVASGAAVIGLGLLAVASIILKAKAKN